MSEVVAALLLLAVTVGVFGIFYTYYVSGLKSSSGSVAKGMQDAAKASGELMSLVYYEFQGQNTINLYLYNYGNQPITLIPPSQAFLISGSQQQQATSFGLYNATSGIPITTIFPQKLVKLTLRFNNIPNTFYIDIVDNIGKTFEFQLSH